jgi:hypothetical protein
MKPLPIVVFVALMSAVGAQANDITAEKMFEKHVSKNDDVGVANTLMRCSGLLALMAKKQRIRASRCSSNLFWVQVRYKVPPR